MLWWYILGAFLPRTYLTIIPLTKFVYSCHQNIFAPNVKCSCTYLKCQERTSKSEARESLELNMANLRQCLFGCQKILYVHIFHILHLAKVLHVTSPSEVCSRQFVWMLTQRIFIISAYLDSKRRRRIESKHFKWKM